MHAPLIATLLLDLLRRQMPGAEVQRFGFGAMAPLFDIAAFEVCGKQQGDKTVRLCARNAEGHLAMEASATLA